jgi:protein-S-isoprenylcysteine O-methyltransferase Ste14
MDRGDITRVWLPLLAGLCGLAFLFLRGPGPHDDLRWLGLFLGLIGLAGVIVSRYTLGRSFSIAARATALVTTGIYSRVRNPIYVSGIVFIAGIFLMLRQPFLWLLTLIVIPMQIVRARREARILEATFGDTYREYRQRTWF